MTHQALFGELIDTHAGLAEELKAAGIAADMSLLLHHAGLTRADLARALGWTRARVTQVLSGKENLTTQTIAVIAKALGYTFDVTYRKAQAHAAPQPWHRQASFLQDVDTGDIDDLRSWMSRKTMQSVHNGFVPVECTFTFDAANQPYAFKESCLAA